MKREHFATQVTRLKRRFGDKAFDSEFVDLLAREVSSMSEYGFTRLIDVMVGSRAANRPPLLVDFREARLREEKRTEERTPQASGQPYFVECQTCNDSGLTNAVDRATKKKYFVYCHNCSDGVRIWKLPTWSKDLANQFDLLPMHGAEARYWKPKALSPERLEESIADKREEWALRVKLSEVFFSER